MKYVIVSSRYLLKIGNLFSLSYRISHNRWMAQIVACLHASLQTICPAEPGSTLINNTCLISGGEWFMKSSMQSYYSSGTSPRYLNHDFIVFYIDHFSSNIAKILLANNFSWGKAYSACRLFYLGAFCCLVLVHCGTGRIFKCRYTLWHL